MLYNVPATDACLHCLRLPQVMRKLLSEINFPYTLCSVNVSPVWVSKQVSDNNNNNNNSDTNNNNNNTNRIQGMDVN